MDPKKPSYTTLGRVTNNSLKNTKVNTKTTGKT